MFSMNIFDEFLLFVLHFHAVEMDWVGLYSLMCSVLNYLKLAFSLSLAWALISDFRVIVSEESNVSSAIFVGIKCEI